MPDRRLAMQTVYPCKAPGQTQLKPEPLNFDLGDLFSFFSLNKRFMRFVFDAQRFAKSIMRFYPFLSVFIRSVGVLSVR